jgi:hypothetical protein
MKRETRLMAVTFAACALGGSLWNGCDPCDCPDPPRLPAATPVLMPLRVQGGYQRDSGPPHAVMPESGSFQVTGDTVVIEYQQTGVTHRVLYDVLPKEE